MRNLSTSVFKKETGAFRFHPDRNALFAAFPFSGHFGSSVLLFADPVSENTPFPEFSLVFFSIPFFFFLPSSASFHSDLSPCSPSCSFSAIFPPRHFFNKAKQQALLPESLLSLLNNIRSPG